MSITSAAPAQAVCQKTTRGTGNMPSPENTTTSQPNQVMSNSTLRNLVLQGYNKDPLYKKVLSNPDRMEDFKVDNRLIYMTNNSQEEAVCIPWEVFLRGRRLVEVIINKAHNAISHFGPMKTSNYIQQQYWWLGMASDIKSFCNSCG